jgi:hypothetical protein
MIAAMYRAGWRACQWFQPFAPGKPLKRFTATFAALHRDPSQG